MKTQNVCTETPFRCSLYRTAVDRFPRQLPQRPMNIRRRALAAGAILILFAVLQLNDPDPWLWVPLYMVPATLVLLLQPHTSSTSRRVLLAVAALYMGLAAWWWQYGQAGISCG